VHKRDVGNPAGEYEDRRGYTTTMTTPHVVYLAHHWIVLAVPALLPAVIVVGVVLYVALRDRRAAGGKPDNPNQRSDAADENRD
jgi:hypothetical protein